MDSATPAFLSFLSEANASLEEVRDVDKALKRALKLARDAFAADEACLAVPEPVGRGASIYASLPGGAIWKNETFAHFLRGGRPRLSPTRLYAGIMRRGRPWGVLALRNRRRTFDKGAVRDVAKIGAVLSRIVQRIDRARLAEVRARIDRKMMEQLRPLDLFYQVLHGLRTLTHYDHSATVLIRDSASGELEVVAEQISWQKGKSLRIGTLVGLDEAALRLLEHGEVLGFDRARGAWREWGHRPAARSLAELVSGCGKDDREAMSVLVAPLSSREEMLGALVVAACHPGSLGAFEAELVQRFLPVVVVSIRNMGRAASLEAGMLDAECRNALATLARGVSHDVNNAFGSVLPMVQQLVDETRSGRIDPELFAKDLEQVEASLQVCRRIFGGMLSMAHSATRTVGEGNLKRAVEGMRAVLQESMRRRRVELVIDLAPGLPFVRGAQSDLEQLVLNLATNARDAMPGGGRLELRASPMDGFVELNISDTGCGIPVEHLARVKEPFFTTKPQGNGLGLSICRSIVWRMRGEMQIGSEVGHGTSVCLRLPVAGEDTDEPAKAGTTEAGE